jgi:hypothetical protein
MKIEHEIVIATRIKVAIEGDVTEYAKSFLAIYNNVKSDRDLLKMYNDYDNGIYLICEKSVSEAAIKFLEQFGTIERVEDVEVVKAWCPDYNFKENIDVEFLEIEE